MSVFAVDMVEANEGLRKVDFNEAKVRCSLHPTLPLSLADVSSVLLVGQRYASSIGAIAIEASAKTAFNIQEMFNQVVLTCFERQTSSLTGKGAGGIKLGGGQAAARAIDSSLSGVSATDLPTFSLTIALLSAVALVACAIPARRAINGNPITALRHE